MSGAGYAAALRNANARLGVQWLSLDLTTKGTKAGKQGNRIKIEVILRRSDARRAKAAAIAQPKNPVSSRDASGSLIA